MPSSLYLESRTQLNVQRHEGVARRTLAFALAHA